jgi:hypothetical protein
MAAEITEAYEWRGRTLIDPVGENIGKVHEVYADGNSPGPAWALVHTGFFGTEAHLVPLTGAEPTGEDVRINVSKDVVKDAPRFAGDAELSDADEARLFEHYNVPYVVGVRRQRPRRAES